MEGKAEYQFPSSVKNGFLEIIPKGKLIATAVVDFPQHADIGTFIETKALNIGRSFKWFIDIDDVKTWLKSK